MPPTIAPAASQFMLVSVHSFDALTNAFTRALGDAGAGVLRDAGFTTGVELAARLRERQAARGAPPPEELPRSAFIAMAADIFLDAGWGTLDVDPSRPQLTVLEVRGWGERSASGTHFTTGMLAGFFGAVSGEELAVLEVDPPVREPGRARFLMGSAGTVNHLFHLLDRGEELATVLGAAG